MAQKHEHNAPHVIEEIESIAERGAQWIRDHLALSVTALLVVLGSAAGFGALSSKQAREADRASNALDRVTADYMRAMGAEPGALEVPELANPDAAEAIRSEFIEEYRSVAEEYSGTVAAALARLEQGNLSAAMGDNEEAIESWRAAIDELAGNRPLQAMFEQRIAKAYEADARWREAAEAYAAAAAVDDYPLRHWALAEAARCYQQAGEVERAREIARTLAVEARALMLPQHLEAMLAELRQIPAP